MPTKTSQIRRMRSMPEGLRAEELRVSMIRASAALHFIGQQRKQLDAQQHNVEQSMRTLAQVAREDGMPRRRIAQALAISITRLGELTGWDVDDLLAENAERTEKAKEKAMAAKCAAREETDATA